MKLNCKNCGIEFELRNAEFNRQVKRGRDPEHFFCKQACATAYNNKRISYVLTPKRAEHLRKLYNPILSAEDERAFNYCLNKCRSKTSHRNKRGRQHEIDIDAEYLKSVWFSQDGKCAVSGIPMILKYKESSEYNPFTGSVDRLDNSKGYIKGNIRYTCLMANYALSTWGDEQLFEFCKAVVYNNTVVQIPSSPLSG